MAAASKDGLLFQWDAVAEMKGTMKGAENPDNLMDEVYPE
jgi:hypothetical protein